MSHNPLETVGEKKQKPKPEQQVSAPPVVPQPTPEQYRQKYADYAKKVIARETSPEKVPYPVLKKLLSASFREMLHKTDDIELSLLLLREIDRAVFEEYLRDHDISHSTCIEGMKLIKYSALLDYLQQEHDLPPQAIPRYLEAIFSEVQQQVQKAINYGNWKAEHLTPLLTVKYSSTKYG